MIVYHGSTEIIQNPDVAHSKKYLDLHKQNLDARYLAEDLIENESALFI